MPAQWSLARPGPWGITLPSPPACHLALSFTHKHNHTALSPTVRHLLPSLLPGLLLCPTVVPIWTPPLCPQTPRPNSSNQHHGQHTHMRAWWTTECINPPALCIAHKAKPHLWLPIWQDNISSTPSTHLSSSLNRGAMTADPDHV